MLKVNKILSCTNVSIEVDKYVPFTVEFESYDSSPPLYWRGGDGRISLIEIGLSRKTGAIRGITLTSLGSENISRSDNELLEIYLPEIKGLPAFDITDWPRGNNFTNNFLDEIPSNFWLLIADDHASLVFDNSVNLECFILNGDIRFGISANGKLSSIDLFGLTQQQLSVIKGMI